MVAHDLNQLAFPTLDAAVIAKKMAKRNFDNARIGDLLKDDGGSWRKK